MRLGFGCELSEDDDRDLVFEYAGRRPRYALDLTEFYLERAQSTSSACTGFAVSQAVFARDSHEGDEPELQSELGLYGNGRMCQAAYKAIRLSQSVETASRVAWTRDSGTSLRWVFKGANRYGMCAASAWPFARRRVTTRPGFGVMAKMRKNRKLRYKRIYGSGAGLVDGMLDALADGFPVVRGARVPQSYVDHRSGVLGPPKEGFESLGGHATTLLGYQNEEVFESGSWDDWGENGDGYAWLSMSYLKATTREAWAVEAVPA